MSTDIDTVFIKYRDINIDMKCVINKTHMVGCMCLKAGMLLAALTSCGRDDLATYVRVRHETSKKDHIHKTQGI